LVAEAVAAGFTPPVIIQSRVMEFAIYLICLGTGLLFTVLSAVAGHFAGHIGHVDGSGGHAEAGADASDSPGVSLFSPTIIAAFIMAFGGFGIVFHEIPATSRAYVSAPLALLGGLLTTVALVFVLRELFRHTQSSSEGKVGGLVGSNATVISPFPANGMGEIAYVQSGTRYTAPAREETGLALASGQNVRITRITGSQFFVRTA
jgi:membrane protein implicated in regulation of membrane protease activity